MKVIFPHLILGVKRGDSKSEDYCIVIQLPEVHLPISQPMLAQDTNENVCSLPCAAHGC
jgi:hypothetical protein